MSRFRWAICGLLSLATFSCLLPAVAENMRQPVIRIVVPAADTVMRSAAVDLADGLHQVYSSYAVELADQPGEAAYSIYLGSPETAPGLKAELGSVEPEGKEGYVVVRSADARKAYVFGSSSLGAAYGIYGMMKKLGFGFYLCGDTTPQRRETFDLSGWELKDTPTINRRLSCNWHGYMSGCTAWDLEQWQQWIGQCRKMGFNGIMIHAYGTTPIFDFTYNGKTRWVARYASTKGGREWRAQHCNNVRRMPGGQSFTKDYFGSDVTEFEGDAHTEAVQSQMKAVFAHAGKLGIKPVFALDIDTHNANDQDMLSTLPDCACIFTPVPDIEFLHQKGGNYRLANPETPEGYGYYKAQLEQLMRLYPELDTICLWVRVQETPMMGLKLKDLPESWRNEYQERIRKNPAAKDYWRSAGMFAVGKVAAAFQKAAKELGHPNLTLSLGTWYGQVLDSANAFMPDGVSIIFLDMPWEKDMAFVNPKTREIFRKVAARRSVTTFLWAQEDNSYYYGSPVPSVENLGSKLRDAKADGYGIINWNSRPLDLFYHCADSQVWKNTFDRTLKASCDDYARHYFSEPTAATIMGGYFDQWMKQGISVGRESGYRFDGIFHDPDSIRPSIQQRLALLDAASRVRTDTNGTDVIAYYRGQEKFCLTFNENERDYHRALVFLKAGRMDDARKEASQCNPERAIEDFASFCAQGGITRGEQGLLVSLNMRWLSYYVALRQALRMESVRYNFNTTVHEPLVHEPGWITLHFDQSKNVWHNYGLAETGATPFKLAPDSVTSLSKELNEIASTGVASDRPFTVKIAPILGWCFGHQSSEANLLAPGRYRLELLLATPSNNANAVFDIALTNNSPFKRFTFPDQKTKWLRILTGQSDAFNAIRLLDRDCCIPAERFTAKPTVVQKEGGGGNDYQTRIAGAKKAESWTGMTCTSGEMLSVNGILINAKHASTVTVQVSDDGKHWQNVSVSPAPTKIPLLRERIDCQTRLKRHDVLKLSYPVTISLEGTLDLQLIPVQEKAFINGLILTPDNS